MHVGLNFTHPESVTGPMGEVKYSLLGGKALEEIVLWQSDGIFPVAAISIT